MSVISPELDYAVKSVSHGTYQLSKVTPQTGSTTVNLVTSSTQESIFELSPKVMNLSKTILSFTSTPDASGANTNNWAHVDGIAHISQMQLYTRTGVFLADINDFNKYTCMTMRRSHKLEDVKTWDKVGDGSGYFEGLTTCNTTTLTDVHALRFNNTTVKSVVDEPSYLVVGGANTATPVIKYQIPLGRIVDSIFALDKDQYFGEVIYLRIVWNASTKICFFNTSSSGDPTGGTPTAFAGDIELTNVVLYSAIEQNPVVIQEIMNKANSGTLSYLVPYIYSNKQSLQASTSQNLSLKYNRAHGSKIKKILWAPFNNTESKNTTYDHNNVADAKVLDFYTMINNVRTSQFNYDTSAGEDWMEKKRHLVGSCIGSSNEYYFNFVHTEDFTSNVPIGDRGDESNYDDGLDLTHEIKYDVVATTASIPLFHYVYAICQKKLTVSPAGVLMA